MMVNGVWIDNISCRRCACRVRSMPVEVLNRILEGERRGR